MVNPETPNPYEAPPIKSDGALVLVVWQIFVLIILGLLTFPAGVIAFFGTCWAAFSIWGRADIGLALGIGVIGGLVVGFSTIAGMTCGMKRLKKHWKQRTDRS